MPVDIEIGLFVMHLLTFFVRQGPKFKKVHVIETERLVETDTLTGFYLLYYIHRTVSCKYCLIIGRIIAKADNCIVIE